MPIQTYDSHTLGYILKEWNEKFINSNIPEPRESSERILAHVLGFKEISDIYNSANNLLSRAEEHLINHLCIKRLERMPIPYIIRQLKFRDLELKMSPPVFIPWIETENLIDIALEVIDVKQPDVVMDLCCGSGAIGLALLHARPQLKIIAVDKSDEACKLTEENAVAHKLFDRLKIIKSKITATGKIEGVTRTFDVIVSNPPYVPFKDIESLGPEFTKYQDRAAVESEHDGLYMIKIVLNAGSSMLNKDGRFIMEVNPTHPASIKSWLEDNEDLGLTFMRSMKDCNNLDRYVEIVKNK